MDSNPRPAAVVVAGMGPVGALLALLLGTRGVPTAVVEPQDRPYPKPRAAVLEIEALRILTALPGLPPLEEWATPLARNGVVDRNRRPLLMIEQTARAYGLPQIARLDQPALEAALRTAAVATGCVEVLAGRSVRGVEQDGDQVTALLDDGRRLTAQWLVGCDGTGSTVRAAAGLGFPGRTFEQPWLVVDAPVRPGADTSPGVGGATEGRASIAFVLDPARPMVAMSQRDRWRWEWMLLPGEDPQAMVADEAVRALIEDWVKPEDVDIERATVFTFYARMADRWRSGRVLLAGDAAHAMPPFAGLGLGLGMRDVIGLAWRLADVVNRVAGPELVDGYERERRPDVAKSTALALRIGRLVQSRSRTAMGFSRALLRATASLPGFATRIGGKPMPARRLPRAVAGSLPQAGRVLPNPWVSVRGGPRVRLDEVIGYRWAYIGHGCDPRDVTTDIPGDAVLLAVGRPEPAPGCLPIEDLDGLLTERPGRVTVARPDRFLHGLI